MTQPGTDTAPLRVAIIGAGPAGFYAAGHLLSHAEVIAEVDLFDRLPTPYGLVRCGVAPDHQKIKAVTRLYAKTAQHQRFRFFGNVELGTHLHVDDLRRHYHHIIYATGAQSDRSLGIPGEHLAGSHSATEFVAWYNGHPDFGNLSFDLSAERVVIIGVGNVAVDVARILCRSVEELQKTDIADYALDALRESQVREVVMLGRRGPAQAAFSYPEAKELGELRMASVHVPPDEARLDPLSQADFEAGADRETRQKVELVRSWTEPPDPDRPRTLTIRFLVSPVALHADDAGHVERMRLVRNELVRTEDGRLRPRATDLFEDLPVDLVFRSVGYLGVRLPGVPFNERRGVIPSAEGRVLGADGHPLVGEYVAGWIKRGPTGVIGTNKADAQETVDQLLADTQEGRHLRPQAPTSAAVEQLVTERQPDAVRFTDWLYLDTLERERGQSQGRPRVKFTRVDAMLDALEHYDATEQPATEATNGASRTPSPPTSTSQETTPTPAPAAVKPARRGKLPPGF